MITRHTIPKVATIYIDLPLPNSGATALREHFASSRVIKGLILQDQHD